MFILVTSLLLLVAAAVFFVRPPSQLPKFASNIAGGVLTLAGLFLFAMLSYIDVPDGQIVTKFRKYLGEPLPAGQIIALDGQRGPQAEIVGPGFHPDFFVRLIYDLDYHQTLVVPEGKIGLVTAH